MKNLIEVKKIKQIKRNKKSIGLCHGVFDILHYGHLKHFEAAKKSVIIYLFQLHLINISKKVLTDLFIMMMSVFQYLKV